MKSCPCCWNGCRMHQAHRTACSTWWACKKQKLAIAEAGVARGVFSPPCVTCGSVESWAPKICCDTTSLGRSFPQPGVVAAALPGVAQVQESCLYELFRACHVSDRMNVHRRSLPCWRGSTRLGKRYSLWSPAKSSGTTCVRAAMIKCGYLYQFWGSLYIFDCGQRWQPQPDRVAARTRWQRGPSRNLGLCRLQECIRGRRMLFLEVLSSFACMWSCQECRSWLFFQAWAFTGAAENMQFSLLVGPWLEHLAKVPDVETLRQLPSQCLLRISWGVPGLISSSECIWNDISIYIYIHM